MKAYISYLFRGAEEYAPEPTIVKSQHETNLPAFVLDVLNEHGISIARTMLVSRSGLGRSLRSSFTRARDTATFKQSFQVKKTIVAIRVAQIGT